MSFDKIFDGSDAHLLPASPAECAAYLRRYNDWRRGDDTIEQPEPKELGFAIAMAAELIDPDGAEIVFTEQQKNAILRDMVNSFQGQFDEIDKLLGLTTGENDPSDIARTREAITGLIRQRDELLAVLVNSRNALESANEMGDGPIVDTIWYSPHETLFDYMDAALAGSQGGAA